MAFIYKIENTLNNKKYIGKTEYKNPHRRWLEHCSQANSERGKNRPLYRAIRKYGKESFTFEILEETEYPVLREQFWISEYKSFGNKGYNCTLGGEGSLKIDRKEVENLYNKGLNGKEIAKVLGCSQGAVLNICKELSTDMKANMVQYSKHRIVMLDKDTLEELRDFTSLTEAIKFIKQNNKRQKSGIHGHIADVCKGNRKTAYGYIWKYKE